MYTTGWTPSEWDEAKAATLRELRQKAIDRASMPNLAIAAELADVNTDVEHILTPGDVARYAASWLPSVDAAQANGRWRHQWESGVEHTRVETPELATVAAPLEAVSRAISDPGIRVDRCRR